jgi:hypothetical protein
MNVWKTTILKNDRTLEIGWHGTARSACEHGFRHALHKSGQFHCSPEKHVVRCTADGVVAALNRFATNTQMEGQP